MKKNINKYSSFVAPIAFILLGINLVRKEETIALVIGYTNIVFWSILLLLTIYAKFIKK